MQPALADLAITEAETLAVMLDSAQKKISRTHTADGGWAWPGDTITSTVTDMCGGFYMILAMATKAGADRGLNAVSL
jgi:hypothetical protein